MQLDWKRLFLTADGRIGRQDFWIGFAILFVGGFILGMIPILGLLTIVLIYPQICLGSKRLHDIGKSGWLMLVPFGVGAVCFILAMIMGGMAIIGAAANNGAASAAALGGMGAAIGVFFLAGLINLAFLLWVGLTPSQPGENRYGPSPEPAFVNNPAPPPAPPAPPAV